MLPTQLHSYLLWRSSVRPQPQELATWRITAAICLMPALMTGIFVYGWWAGILVLASCTAAFITDYVCHRWVFRDSPGTRDGTWLLTGLLLAMLMPPNAPLWLPIAGAALALFVGKHYLAVDGMPLLQPALVGLVGMCLVSLVTAFGGDNLMYGTKDGKPQWPVLIREIQPSDGLGASPDGLTKLLRDFFGGDIRKSITRERYREATVGDTPRSVKAQAVHDGRPLDKIKAAPGQVVAHPVSGQPMGAWDMILGYLPGTIGGSSAGALILGILYLIFSGSASWVVPGFSMAGMFALLHFFAWLTPASVDPGNVVIHLLSGSTLLWIFFLAADPLTAPRSFTGRVYAGITLALVEVLLRVFTPLPEALPISVLVVQGLAYVYDQILAPPKDEPPASTLPGSALGGYGRV